jgi:hypothetical protein
MLPPSTPWLCSTISHQTQQMEITGRTLLWWLVPRCISQTLPRPHHFCQGHMHTADHQHCFLQASLHHATHHHSSQCSCTSLARSHTHSIPTEQCPGHHTVWWHPHHARSVCTPQITYWHALATISGMFWSHTTFPCHIWHQLQLPVPPANAPRVTPQLPHPTIQDWKMSLASLMPINRTQHLKKPHRLWSWVVFVLVPWVGLISIPC